MDTPLDSTLVSFIVPVLNDAARLERCLASIRATGPGLELLVVDNGSVDGSPEVGERAGATVLRRPGLSVAALRNAGAERATGAILAFVDADHEIVHDWTAVARQLFSAAGDVAVLGTAYTSPRRGWVQRAYDGLRARQAGSRRVAWLGAGNLAVRRDAFTTIGGFDPRLRTCEDVDFCRRTRRAGLAIVDDPRLVSVHTGDPETLRAVFSGELWRGRDNLAVSFRPPLDLRSLASALVPVAVLLLLVAAAVIGASRSALAAAAVTLGVFAAVTLLRTGQMCVNRRAWKAADVLQSMAVAACFELGRALALVARAGHGGRRRSNERLSQAAP